MWIHATPVTFPATVFIDDDGKIVVWFASNVIEVDEWHYVNETWFEKTDFEDFDNYY